MVCNHTHTHTHRATVWLGLCAWLQFNWKLRPVLNPRRSEGQQPSGKSLKTFHRWCPKTTCPIMSNTHLLRTTEKKAGDYWLKVRAIVYLPFTLLWHRCISITGIFTVYHKSGSEIWHCCVVSTLTLSKGYLVVVIKKKWNKHKKHFQTAVRISWNVCVWINVRNYLCSPVGRW